MAIPFQVFDHGRNGMLRQDQVNYIWCIRCEAWIPLEEACGVVGSAYDPHVYDHVKVYYELKRTDLKEMIWQ